MAGLRKPDVPAGKIQKLFDALHDLHHRAGWPSARKLGRSLQCHHSTIAVVFQGPKVPKWQTLDLVVAELGGDTLQFRRLWYEASREEQYLGIGANPAAAQAPISSDTPYRGLETFQPEDAEWFYGRERPTDGLVARLAEVSRSGGMLAVVGPSGSGKSSILRAGLVPAVRAGRLATGLVDWRVALFTPGGDPLRSLAAQLETVTGMAAGVLEAALRTDPSRCAVLVHQATTNRVAQHGQTRNGSRGILADDGAGAPAGSGTEPMPARARPQAVDQAVGAARCTVLGLLVIVDQFEEVFTSGLNESERRCFVSALCAAAAGGRSDLVAPRALDDEVAGPIVVVLGLRADFYAEAARYSSLVPVLQDAQFLVGPMTEPEVRRVITEPARKVALHLEEGLVELLLRDMAPAAWDGSAGAAHDPGALPLLSHALLATWQRRRGDRLTVADYRECGGIHGAVAQTADRVCDELAETQQDIVRQLFLRLVNIDEDTAETRRRVPRSELVPDRGVADLGEAGQVLDRFVGQRLLTADADTVEITHEALIRAWPRLRAWLDADRAGLRTHRQLTVAARAWRESHRDPNTLYRGARLATCREWAYDRDHLDDLNPQEREFLEASIRQQTAEQRAERRRAHRRNRVRAALAVLLLVAGSLTGYVLRLRTDAHRERDLAVSREVAVEADRLRSSDPALATQLALAAYRIAPTAEARASLLDSSAGPAITRVLGPSGVMQTVAVSGNGKIMAAAGTDPAVRLWSLADPRRAMPIGQPLGGHTDTIYSVAFSPDGRLLASGSGDKTIQLWNVTNPAQPVSLARKLPRGPANTVYSVAFSPNGRLLAAGSADNTVRLWDLTHPSTPEPIAVPPNGLANYVQSVAFSPDSKTLAAGSADRTVRLWDLTRPRAPRPLGRPLTGATNTVFSVAFSPDGRLLAAGSRDRTVRLWNITNRRVPIPLGPPLTGPGSWVNAVAFSPDGRTLAAASSDDTVRIFMIATHRVIAVLPHPAPVTAIAYLHRGAQLASSAADGDARIWTAPGPAFVAAADRVNTVTFSADGQTLAAGSSDSTIGLWDVADTQHPTPRGPLITDPAAPGGHKLDGTVAITRDGHTLAAGGTDGRVWVWDITDPLMPTMLGPPLTGLRDYIEWVTFSPDGHTLAAASDDHTVRLWDVTTPPQPHALATLTGPTNYVFTVAFSPDGHTLAAGSVDHSIWLWNVTDPHHPQVLGPPLTGPTNYVYAVAFSPDGHTLAAGSADHKVWMWNIRQPTRPSLVTALSGPTNYVFTVAFSPDGHTLAAGSADKTVWLWDLTPGAAAHAIAVLTRSSDAVLVVEFSPDGHTLAAGSADNTVRLWNTDPEQAAAKICSIAGDLITADEWNQYVSLQPYRPPC